MASAKERSGLRVYGPAALQDALHAGSLRVGSQGTACSATADVTFWTVLSVEAVYNDARGSLVALKRARCYRAVVLRAHTKTTVRVADDASNVPNGPFFALSPSPTTRRPAELRWINDLRGGRLVGCGLQHRAAGSYSPPAFEQPLACVDSIGPPRCR